MSVVSIGIIAVGSVWPQYHTYYADEDTWREVSLTGGNLSVVTIRNDGMWFFHIAMDSMASGREMVHQHHGQVLSLPMTRRLMANQQVTCGGFNVHFGVPALLGVLMSVMFGCAAYAQRRERFLKGKCQWCAYDLTGNVSGRCPECGRSVADLHREVSPVGECES